MKELSADMEQLCVCGCSRNWHSLISDRFVPAMSGCLYCMKCPAFKAQMKSEAVHDKA